MQKTMTMTKQKYKSPFKKLVAVLLLLLRACLTASGQYVLTGKVVYERKVNVHAQYEGNEWFDRFKADVPKFNSTDFLLMFDSGRTMYRPAHEIENTNRWANTPANENVVYTDFNTGNVAALKMIFETKFLVKDTVRALTWKEKPEIRTIAGHACHKAVSVICDSVFVVAFYAEDIPVSGGPELFGGLPGLILELAVPRLHTTWVATKIDRLSSDDLPFKQPEKGKKVTNQQLQESIKESFKDWGKNAGRYVWWTTL
jgi:GLPGLI family protein